MEPEDLRRRSQPFSSDPKPLPELARSASASASSDVMLDNASKHLSRQSAAAPLLQDETVPVISRLVSRSFQRFCALLFWCLSAQLCFELLSPDQSTRWTDEKHNLYIRSLEASFVNGLHHSMFLRGWSLKNSTDETYKCRILLNSHNMPPRQSLALQDGCQKKINLERISPMLESTADSHVLAGSQFELTSVDRSCSLREPNTCKHELVCEEDARGSSTFTDMSARSLEKQSICCSFHLDLACSTTEVTDQNFKDKEARSSCMPMVKRLKTAIADGSSSDQVGKFHTPDVSTSSNSTS
ncbi:uncharacterized protein LOC109789040 isoform X1 [Cajanus cajan]|uniref:uncharacterized protein LOC109789040 isoform X1 n=1 Tax=Cajanus cajan TaxID=3821 RepID=UPI0010FBAAD1|nr:uncharacterized protein LOC109789040 isoform X1 [Cajanus cajan]